jgi:hypothetical protein
METKSVITVPMHGPSISDPSRIVNRDVPVRDVEAYKAVGYVKGHIVEEPVVEVVVEEKPKKRGK